MRTAEEILRAKLCGDIFSRSEKAIVVSEYREMARAYHPDVCKLPNATEITAKINELYSTALHLIELGKWESSNSVQFQDTAGKKYISRFLKTAPFELGTMYISDGAVIYVFETQYSRYYDNAVSQIKALDYADETMKTEMSRFMPTIRFNFETTDGKKVLILKKTHDVFLLSDVQKAFGGKIPDRHVAWIISRLCNLCCYFDYTGIAHNGLTIDNCLISPEYHTVMPLGGWWYTKKIGEPLIGVPRSVYDVMPIKAKSDKISSCQTDLEAIKLIGRQLIDKDTAPKPIMDFLNCGSSANARNEFAKWDSALDAAYGKRQFVEMKINKSNIYQ